MSFKFLSAGAPAFLAAASPAPGKSVVYCSINYFYMKTFMLMMLLLAGYALKAQPKTVPEQLAQQQLDGYNARNIEAFLVPYADSVAVYQFPNQLQYKGKETMRRQYAGMFSSMPALHCTLQSRLVQGNTVIDEELVVFEKDKPAMHFIAIYVIENNKIASVYFIPPLMK
jgi:hypothetical protein